MEKKFFDRIIFFILMLTFTSGFANVLSIFTVGIPSTHMTGNLANISYSLFEMNFAKATVLGLYILLFIMGGVISGFIFSNRQFGKGKSYGVILIAAAIVLVIAEIFIGNRYILTGIVVITSGTQNGLNIMYDGMCIRTTHMTGYLSDIGKTIGVKISGKRIDVSRLRYLILAVVIYFLGGIVAIVVSLPENGHNFYEVALFYVLSGIFYLTFIYRENKEIN